MDWTQVLTLALTTGVVTTLMNVGYTELKDWRSLRRQRKRHAGYLALRLAISLERFVDEACDFCSSVAENYVGPAEPLPATPALSEYPSDDDGWRDLDTALAARCLAFPNAIASARGLVRAMADDEVRRDREVREGPVDPDQLPGETQLSDLLEREWLKLILAAVELARDVRKHYELPRYEPAYDSEEWATERLQQVLSIEKVKDEARKRFVGLFGDQKVTLSDDGTPFRLGGDPREVFGELDGLVVRKDGTIDHDGNQ